ncbi:CHAP domain-containing protein [Flavobacterium sp.]|uniref:CHAP domain-containing protein n=1 Tax=Flavobacterium sp. TaxID=239 RepID=UPI002FDB3F6F
MDYPNRMIKKGDTDKAIVKAIQRQLNLKNCGPLTVDGDFGEITKSAVKLFQTRHTDASGQALKADGVVGALTWYQLFESTLTLETAPNSLLGKALEIAATQIGVLENPLYSNRGTEVDQYLKRAGLDPEGQHYSWCAAFVYWCFDEAAKALAITNPLYKTAGVLNHWNHSTAQKLSPAQAKADSSLIKPGAIFIIDHGSGQGHTGIVEKVEGGNLTTIEGNTNQQKSSNGYGVFRLTTRKVQDINKGFLIY